MQGVLTVLISVIVFVNYYAAGHESSVQEILPEYGLPCGLFPNSVAKYTIGEDGNFTVELLKPCYVNFEYLVYYNQVITGKLSYGSITELKGIQVKRLFFWLDVDEIRVDLPPSDYIYFQVGFIYKRLDSAQFQVIRSCRSENVSCRIQPDDLRYSLLTDMNKLSCNNNGELDGSPEEQMFIAI